MRRLAAIFASVALLACGSEPTALDDGPQVAASVEVIENDSLSVEAGGTSETVVAVLRDSDGNPVAGGLSSWEIEGGTEDECGFWESGSVQSGADGEVENFLHAGTVAWTASASPDCRYRVVDASEGAPEPLRDSVQVRVEPGDPSGIRLTETVEDSAVAQPAVIWRDEHRNPVAYEAEVTSGPATVVVASGAPEWTRSVQADAVGSGEVEIWSLPDSSRAVTATFDITDAGGYLWICLQLPDGGDDDTTTPACEGPPN